MLYICTKGVTYLKVKLCYLLNLNVMMLIYFEGQLLNLGYDFQKVMQADLSVLVVVHCDFFLQW